MDARLILDPPAAGDWNMAVDEALLAGAAESNQPVLRFYEWSEPTLSLGYFQAYNERRTHPASLHCPCVRRTTGGGAILHDRELTYSLVVPTGVWPAKGPQSMYQAVHGCLISALGARGIVAGRADSSASLTQAGESFLCFERRAAEDVLIGSHKIAGSAQRRHRGAVLQHGSILYAKSSAAPELQGIVEVAGQDVPVREFASQIAWRLSELLGWKWQTSTLTSREEVHAAELQDERFSAATWTRRR